MFLILDNLIKKYSFSNIYGLLLKKLVDCGPLLVPYLINENNWCLGTIQIWQNSKFLLRHYGYLICFCDRTGNNFFRIVSIRTTFVVLGSFWNIHPVDCCLVSLSYAYTYNLSPVIVIYTSFDAPPWHLFSPIDASLRLCKIKFEHSMSHNDLELITFTQHQCFRILNYRFSTTLMILVSDQMATKFKFIIKALHSSKKLALLPKWK